MLQQAPLSACIPVREVGLARQFYEQKLGFRVAGEMAVAHDLHQPSGHGPLRQACERRVPLFREFAVMRTVETCGDDVLDTAAEKVGA